MPDSMIISSVSLSSYSITTSCSHDCIKDRSAVAVRPAAGAVGTELASAMVVIFGLLNKLQQMLRMDASIEAGCHARITAK
jgi:hypothetical protein